MLNDLRQQYGAADQVYMTGFSGGGNATYRMIGNHPELLAAAIPVCANYAGGLLDHRQETRGVARDLPIYQLLGEVDHLNGPWTRFPMPPTHAAALLFVMGVSLGYVANKRLNRRRPGIAVFVFVVLGGAWVTQYWTCPGIEAQTDHAAQHLRELGFSNVRRVIVPGVGHSESPEQVFEIVAPLIPATRS
jgi:hypothetical protein